MILKILTKDKSPKDFKMGLKPDCNKNSEKFIFTEEKIQIEKLQKGSYHKQTYNNFEQNKICISPSKFTNINTKLSVKEI